MYGQAPQYLRNLIREYVPGRNLRSSGTKQLAVQRTMSSLGEKAFISAAPSLWNALPLRIRLLESLETFKKNLKSYMFACYFS